MMKNYLVIKGNATYDDTLIKAVIKRARGKVVCSGDDSLNMYVILADKRDEPNLLIIVRGYKLDGEKRMLRAGANLVIYPLKLSETTNGADYGLFIKIVQTFSKK